MDEAKSSPKESEEKSVAQKKGSKTNTIMLVQTVVCIAAVLLIFLLSKLSPKTFEFIKDEYDRIMSVDMDAEEMADSVKKIADKTDTDVEEQESSENTTAVVSTVKSASDGEAVAVMSTFQSDEDITVPVHGWISSEYGNRTNPVTGEYLMHSGVDIAADQGTEIQAAYSGIVSEVGSDSVNGNYIKLVHTDGSETMYLHCSKIIAEKGAVIRAGETIALVGSTGRSTGPHLHFEIHINGESVDPLIYLPNENGEI